MSYQVADNAEPHRSYTDAIPTLYIFSGLPGTGKTTLSQVLARKASAVYLRIDTVEQALRELCEIDVRGKGYSLRYRIAADNLKLGLSVVADSCNPIELTRDEWEGVASESQARFVNVEIICSEEAEHRRRIETRVSTVSGLRLPTWTEVKNREYDPWTRDRIIIETSGKSETDCFDDLVHRLSEFGI